MPLHVVHSPPIAPLTLHAAARRTLTTHCTAHPHLPLHRSLPLARQASVTPEADGMCAFSHLGVNPLDKALLLRQALLALAERRAERVHHPTLHAAVGRSTNLLSAHVSASAGA